ncbi:MAG: T9SS type A sorting domain-containing protein [Chitinophagaceae bacterium]
MKSLILALFLFATVIAYAQTAPFGQLEPCLNSNAVAAGNTSLPFRTLGPVSYTLLNNTSNPNTFAAYNPALTVTATVINNQYPTSSNGTNQSVFINAPNWDMMGWIDFQSTAYWSTDQFNIGTGISNGSNYGYRMQTYLADITNPVNAYLVSAGKTYTYMADLQITFSRPVNNPILHICGFGGTTGNLHFANELKLLTPNISLLKLSGNNIDIDSVTKIVNTRAAPGGTSSSGQGSFELVGTGITSLILRVSVRTDNGQTSWGSGSQDAWTFSFSLAPPQTISGKFFYDVNGLTNNTVDGTGTNLSGTMYANLVDAQGKVISSVPVAADGSYNFPEAFTGAQTIQLTSTQGVAGNPSITTLPAGWAFTGENIGAGAGNDGTQDGATPVTVLQLPTSNANFGVEQIPSGANYTASSVNNPGGTNTVTVPAAAFTGSDPEDGVYAPGLNGKTVTLSPAVNGTLYYNNTPVTATQTINPFNPALVAMDPNDNVTATLTTSFDYAVQDAAGVSSAAKTITMPFALSALPLHSISLSGKYSTGKANLFWEVRGAQRISHFEIERSSNGSNFILVGSVESKGDGDFSYTFINTVDVPGAALYYRIKSVDEDGEYFYSAVFKLITGSKEMQVKLLPNPFTNSITILATSTHQTEMAIKILNANGQTVLNQRRTLKAGTNNIEITDMGKLPAGTYTANIIVDGQQTTRRLIKMKE